MIETFPVAFVFLFGALVMIAFPKGWVRSSFLLIIPATTFFLIYFLPEGNLWSINFLDYNLEFMRVDKLSRIFGLIFCIAAFLSYLYSWHICDTTQQMAALGYAGSAIGAVFAGDLLTLFLYWECTALTSVFFIWARKTEGSFHTGLRYLIIQIASGVVLLAGTALIYFDSGSINFEKMHLNSLGEYLIFFAFGIKCAFPLLHNWLQDSYPAATVTGTVIMSAFTTKLAVYALARGFPGVEALIYIGAIMALFPIFYAVIENDLRRVLAYSLNNQLGFMVVGIGIGTELALNGTVAHAFACILYKALLFMCVGAVLFRTGTAKGSELGGLYRTMPFTMVFCIIGAASVSAFPLFSGFISKSLIISASVSEGYNVVWAILLLASAGVVYHSGIKVPYFMFFAHDSGLRPQEAPRHILVAMGITGFLCLLLGVYPDFLYRFLPFIVDYEPYSTTHIISQLQLLFFSALALMVLMRTGMYPSNLRLINVDTDWAYRRALPSFLSSVLALYESKVNFLIEKVESFFGALFVLIRNMHKPRSNIFWNFSSSTIVFWTTFGLSVVLFISFIF